MSYKKHCVSVATTAQLIVEIKEYHSESHMESMLYHVGKMQSVLNVKPGVTLLQPLRFEGLE